MTRFLQLSDGRFEGDGIDEAVLALSVCGSEIPASRYVMSDTERAEAKRIYRQRYRKAHPEQHRAESRNRRAVKRAADGKITSAEWAELCDKHENRCLRCGACDVKLTLDHVIPLALGGANTIDNAQPLCALCNSIKGAKHIDYR